LPAGMRRTAYGAIEDQTKVCGKGGAPPAADREQW
jgi:hypothetical protein